MTTVTGLIATNACSQPGIEDAGAKTELTKVSGITSRKPAVRTVSALRSATPRKVGNDFYAVQTARIEGLARDANRP